MAVNGLRAPQLPSVLGHSTVAWGESKEASRSTLITNDLRYHLPLQQPPELSLLEARL